MIETALVSTILGATSKIFTGWMERRDAHKNQQLDFKRSQLEAKEAALTRQHEREMAKVSAQDMAARADLDARLSMRNTDTQALIAAIEAEKTGGGGVYIEALRAAVRPMLVFALTGYVVWEGGLDDPTTVLEVWGMAVGFYFGGRVRAGG